MQPRYTSGRRRTKPRNRRKKAYPITPLVLHKYMEEEVSAYQEEILKESDKMVRYRVEKMPTRTL